MKMMMDMSNVGEMLNAFVLNADEDFVYVHEVENSLYVYHREVCAGCVDTFACMIEDHPFYVVSKASSEQDKSLKITGISAEDKVMFRGNLMVFGYGIGIHGRGMMQALDDSEVELLYRNLAMVNGENENGKYNTYCICNMGPFKE